MTDVARIALSVDLHLSEIHLTMIDRHGARVGFALPLELAQELAERLPVGVAEIAEAAKTWTRQ
jgi:hypothetical protein